MKILELHLMEFGGLKNRRITLSEGFNLFEGENESGKSTVLLFIKFMLYGIGRKHQEDYERSVSRDGHRAAGSMTVRVEEEEYRIERVFTEGTRSGSERLSILRTSDGEQVGAGRQPGELFLGVSREVFESSAYIGQMKVDTVSDKKGSDAIRNLLSSADETTDITRIEDKLEKIRVTYRHKTGKGGRLHELSEQTAAERQRYERALQMHRKIATEQERFDRAQEQAEENEQQLERTNRLLLQIGKRDLLSRFDRLHQTEKDWHHLQAIRADVRQKFKKTEYMPTPSDVAELRHLAACADEADVALRRATEERESRGVAQVDELRARHAEQIAKLGGYEAFSDRIGALRTRKILTWILCALGVVSIPILLLWNPMLSLIGLTVAILFGVLGIVSTRKLGQLASEYGCRAKQLLSYAKECEDYAIALQNSHQTADRLALEVAHAEEQRALADMRLLESMKKTLPSAEQADAAQALAEAERIEQYLHADREAEIREQSLAQMIAREQEALSEYDEATLRSEIDPELYSITPEQIARAEREQKFYAEKKKTLEASMRQSQIELISARAGADAPAPIADRLAELEAETARAERYADALELALESLRDAAKSLSGSVTPTLAKDASAMMRELSGGRYCELSAGATFEPTLLSESGMSVPTELMSGGTRDAAYLALRLSLMMQIYAGARPPILMDESLCQLDDRRAAQVLSLLGRLCDGEQQCLLFTCHRREGELCRAAEIRCHTVTL